MDNRNKSEISNDDTAKKEKRDIFISPAPTERKEELENGDKNKEVTLKAPGCSNIISNNYFDFHHTSSTIFGGPGFFASPISPAYPNTSSINYLSVPFHTENTQKNIQNNMSVHQENTVNSIIADTKNNLQINNENSEIISRHSQKESYGVLGSSHGLPSDILPILQNIVSTANLKCTLDLREIALRAKNAEYNPKRFAAVIMRIREPKTTALIFASGKMVCTGARSEEDSKKAARQYAKIIHKLGNPVKFSEFKIQNIVGSCDVKFPIRLEGLANGYSKFCSYEPEMFPGLIFRMIKPKIVLLIFVSGKIVLTGAKERHDIYQAFENIYPVLQNYKKKDIAGSISTELSMANQDKSK